MGRGRGVRVAATVDENVVFGFLLCCVVKREKVQFHKIGPTQNGRESRAEGM